MNSMELKSFAKNTYLNDIILRKWLFEHIKSLQCYDLVRRCSHSHTLPLTLMCIIGLCIVNVHWCRNSNWFIFGIKQERTLTELVHCIFFYFYADFHERLSNNWLAPPWFWALSKKSWIHPGLFPNSKNFIFPALLVTIYHSIWVKNKYESDNKSFYVV